MSQTDHSPPALRGVLPVLQMPYHEEESLDFLSTKRLARRWTDCII